MRVSMNKVTLLSAAVAALFASAAQAAVNLNTGATAPIYASEAAVAVTGLSLANTAAALTSTVTLGFSISGSQTRFIRFDLANGNFGTQVAPADLTISGLPFANRVVTGGAATDTYVIFQVTTDPAGNAQSEIVSFAPAQVRALTAANVSITYSLHDTAFSASNATTSPAVAQNNARLINTGPTVLARFSPAVTMTALPVAAETVAATTNFVKFCTGAGGLPGTAGCASTATDFQGLMGTIATYALVSGVLNPITGAAVVDVATIVSTGANVVVTGDFSAAAGTTNGASHTPATVPGTAGVCAAGTAVTSTATIATFPVSNVAYAGGSINPLCMTVGGTAGIAAQSFTAVFNRVASGAAWTTGTINLGTVGQFVRDGAELQTPWFSFGGTRYISRFFFMNTGSVAANCTAVILAETGNTVTGGSATTTGFVVPAGGQVAVLGTDVASAATVSGRAAARFTCLAPSANIQGRYVITDSVSGALDSGTMLRPGTN